MLAKLMLCASMALPLRAQTDDEEIAAHARAAQAAEQRNDFPAAVREYEHLTHLLPQNAEMQSNLGVALYFNQETARAISVFRKAISLNSDLLAPHLFSGLAWYRLSNPDAAVPMLEQATRINPSDVLARTWLGYAYVAQLRYEDALREFQTACQLDPSNIDVWYARGQSHLQIGRDTTLLLLSTAPDGGRTWQLAGEQFQLRGDPQNALTLYQQALERRPDIPELRKLVTEMGGELPKNSLLQQADTTREDQLYRRAHDEEQNAQESFERVLEIAPHSYRAHQIMADTLAAEGRLDDAIEEYRAVLKLKPDLPGIHEAVGNNLLRAGKLAESLEEYKSELNRQPLSATANTNVGRVLLLMGNDSAAEKVLSRALTQDRPPTEIYKLFGKLNLAQHHYQTAITHLTRYVSMMPNDASAYYLLVRAYRAVGDAEHATQASELYERASQDAKDRSRAQKALESFRRQNQSPEGMEEQGKPVRQPLE
jgi:tetratricopeptide (TPR) repeat protein